MPTPGFFEIYPSARPALPTGAYLLAADHDLVATPPHNADGQLSVDGSDFTFKIISPRYTMPPDQILSTFPPASAVGDWSQRLPQIVFKRRTLPWERNPDPDKVFDDATPPWLALVVLAEGEGSLSGDVPIAECVTPGTRMAGDADTATSRYLSVRESIVKKIFPRRDDLELLCHVRKVDLADTELALGDDDGYLAVVISNRLPQPGPPKEPGGAPTSVRYTACLVNLEDQLPALPTVEESESVFEFVGYMPELADAQLFATAPDAPADVIVMQGLGAMSLSGNAISSTVGNALPSGASASAGTYEVAKGVESSAAAYATGPAALAPLDAGAGYAAKKWKEGAFLGEMAELDDSIGIVRFEKMFRFPVMVTWDFVCTGDGTFEQLMERLDSGMLGTVDDDADPALQPDVAVTGHISLQHRTRRGEPAESWYRGPFVPQPTERTKPAPDGSLPLAHTGDQLRRVVPDGHEDVGVAAAFEIGRLLALSKPGIVAAMMGWREELFGASRVREIARMFVGELSPSVTDAFGLGKSKLEDLIANELLVAYAERAPDVVGPRSKSFASARVPEELAGARTTDVLTGFGLDAAQVKAATAEFGIGGLGSLDVVVGAAATSPLSDSKDEIEMLRSDLQAHVERIAIEALKLGDVGPGGAVPGGPGGKKSRTKPRSPRRPARDELDRLIASANSDPTDGGR